MYTQLHYAASFCIMNNLSYSMREFCDRFRRVTEIRNESGAAFWRFAEEFRSGPGVLKLHALRQLRFSVTKDARNPRLALIRVPCRSRCCAETWFLSSMGRTRRLPQFCPERAPHIFRCLKSQFSSTQLCIVQVSSVCELRE